MVGKGRILFRFGPFELDRTARVLFRGTDPVPLAPRTVDTLIVLLEAAGRVLTKEELMAAIWPDRAVEEVNLTQQMSLLRKALASQDSTTEYIRNFPGRGYQFIVPIEKPADVPVPKSRKRWRWILLAGACLTAAAVAIWVALPSHEPEEARGLRRIPLSRLPGSKSHPALSPDGARVAFVWNKADGNGPCIYVKTDGREEPDLLRGTCGNPSSPAWSADGRRLAYFRNLPGGSELVVLGELGQDRVLKRFYPLRSLIGNRLLSWSPDGKWIAACGKEEAEQPLTVHLIPAEGGPGRILTHPDSSAIGDADPAFSPDSRSLTFVRMSSRFTMQLGVVPVAGGPSKTIVAGDQLIGGVVWSPDGRDVIFSANRSGGYRLWRVRPEAEPGEPVPDPSGIAGENPIQLSLSHAANRLAYVVTGEDLNIWRLKVRGKHEWSQVIASTGMDAAPQYSPDGSKICFVSDRSGEEHIWVANADGSDPRKLTSRSMSPGHCSWSADNRSVLFVAHGGGFGGVFAVPAAGGDPRQIPLKGYGSLPVMSPDGRILYVVRQSGGRYELFSATLSNGESVQLTHTGAHRARVSRDGRWIYYVQARTSPTIWRIGPNGDRNERVLDGLIPGYFGAWALASDGIYYLGEDPSSQRPAILFFNLDLRTTSVVAPLPSALPPLGLTEFSLSPDGETLLAVLRESLSSDLMSVSGFR